MGTNNLSELWFPINVIHGNRLVLSDGSCARSLTLQQVLVLLCLMGNGLLSWVRDLIPNMSSLEQSTVRWLKDWYAQAGYADIRVSAVHDFFILRKFLYGDKTKPLPCINGNSSKIKIRTGVYDKQKLKQILESFHGTDSWSRWFEQRQFLWVLAPLINPIRGQFLWLKDGISESLVQNTMAVLERKHNE